MASISSPPTRVNSSRLKSEKQTLTKALAISGCSCRNSLVMMGKWWVSDGLSQYLSSLHVFFSSSNFDSKTRCVFFHWSLFLLCESFPQCFLCCLVLCPHEQPPTVVNILHNPRYHIVASEKKFHVLLNNSHVLMENLGVTNSLPSKH